MALAFFVIALAVFPVFASAARIDVELAGAEVKNSKEPDAPCSPSPGPSRGAATPAR
ncbi:MAG: hypothetical protein ACOYD4_06645 [Solirubrobacterales bacterium]